MLVVVVVVMVVMMVFVAPAGHRWHRAVTVHRLRVQQARRPAYRVCGCVCVSHMRCDAMRKWLLDAREEGLEIISNDSGV